MESTRLTRTAGTVAIVAGTLVLLNRIATFIMIPTELSGLQEVVVTPAYTVLSVSQIVASGMLIFVPFTLHQVQVAGSGRLGGIGVAAAIIGTVFMAGDWWYEAFAVPWLADVAPIVFETGAGGHLLAGGVTSFVLFGLGWATYGAATYRAHVLPRGLAAGIVIGGLGSGIPIAGAYLYGNAVLAAALIGVGAWLMRPAPSVAAASRRLGNA